MNRKTVGSRAGDQAQSCVDLFCAFLEPDFAVAFFIQVKWNVFVGHVADRHYALWTRTNWEGLASQFQNDSASSPFRSLILLQSFVKILDEGFELDTIAVDGPIFGSAEKFV